MGMKPCPMCGGRPEIDPDGAEFARDGRGYAIECRKCNLQFWSFHSEPPKKLITRWNTRTERSGDERAE